MDIVERLRAAGCVFAEDEARLLIEAAADPGGETLEQLLARRVSGEPLEHLLGWVDFAGLRLAVGPGVFVPRRRTELLARQAAAALEPAGLAVELCCGVAPVAAVLLDAVPGVEVHAADIDSAAVCCARTNLAGPAAHVHQGDLYTALPAGLAGRVDLIAANAPYVPTHAIATMPPEARDHEPRIALDGGGDGVDLHRRVALEAARWLRPGGLLLIETGRRQAAITLAAFEDAGLTGNAIARDDDVEGTVVLGRAPPP